MSICIPELLLQVFEHLPLPDLISAMHVNQQWRALVPEIDASIRTRLLALAFQPNPTQWPVDLQTRQKYVEKVETDPEFTIPDPYRTLLLEWPSSHPPPTMHWPHSLRFLASGFCYCFRQLHEDPSQCHCRRDVAVGKRSLYIFNAVYDWVVQHGTAPNNYEAECAHEIFCAGTRLRAPSHAQTIRLIMAHKERFQWRGRWGDLPFRVLPLSRYWEAEDDQSSSGVFVMILDGEARGQIHAWSENGESWYDGFEAETWWEWKYVEWDPTAHERHRESPRAQSDDGESENE
uniref:F-box domain-containing protein n=1 Tax=Mycena chlorophos TaxID=658473 RepID=A0ABQ0MDI5_MYCCL|nr:predicted protein [Mycena chlorophos]